MIEKLGIGLGTKLQEPPIVIIEVGMQEMLNGLETSSHSNRRKRNISRIDGKYDFANYL